MKAVQRIMHCFREFQVRIQENSGKITSTNLRNNRTLFEFFTVVYLRTFPHQGPNETHQTFSSLGIFKGSFVNVVLELPPAHSFESM